MKGFWSVYRRELYSAFASAIFYVVAFTFVVIAGYFFYSAMLYFNLISFQAAQRPLAAAQLNVTDMVLRPFFMDISIVLLLIAPLLTMRLYAEERKAGTMELLFTYPLTDRATVMAKFGAAVTVLGVILAGTAPSMIALNSISEPHWPAVFCGYLGIFLLGSSFIALGLFTSSLTQNQIIAAVLSFGALLMFWIIGWLKSIVGPGSSAVVEYLAVTQHLENFANGVLDSRDIAYYLAFIVFFIFLTLRRVESFRWSGSL